MFDKEYSFKGKHAEMVNKLTAEFDIKKNKLFSRNFDVYLLAPVVGFLYQRKAEVDNSNSEATKIFAEILIKNSEELKYNFRLIMLLDKDHEADTEKRIDKTFRGNTTQEDIDCYEQYVRGGVEVLYEKLIESANTSDDYITNLYDFLEEFDERYNQNIDLETILAQCKKIVN